MINHFDPLHHCLTIFFQIVIVHTIKILLDFCCFWHYVLYVSYVKTSTEVLCLKKQPKKSTKNLTKKSYQKKWPKKAT